MSEIKKYASIIFAILIMIAIYIFCGEHISLGTIDYYYIENDEGLTMVHDNVYVYKQYDTTDDDGNPIKKYGWLPTDDESDFWNPYDTEKGENDVEEYVTSDAWNIIGKVWWQRWSVDGTCFFRNHIVNGKGTCFYHISEYTESMASNTQILYVLTTKYDPDDGIFKVQTLYTYDWDDTTTATKHNVECEFDVYNNTYLSKVVAHMEITNNSWTIRYFLKTWLENLSAQAKKDAIVNGTNATGIYYPEMISGDFGGVGSNSYDEQSAGVSTSVSGSNITITSDNSEWEKYKNFKALQYHNGTQTSASEYATVNDYTIIGPFSVDYDGNYIESIQVYDTTYTAKTTTSGKTYESTDGTQIYICNSDYSSELGEGEINTGSDFYLAVPTSKLPEEEGISYKVIITQEELDYAISRLTVTTGLTGEQEMGVYDTYDSNDYVIHVSIDWDITSEGRGKSLTLIKYDINAYTTLGGNENPYVTENSELDGYTGRLLGCEFIIYAKNTTLEGGSGWLTGSADGTKTLVDNVNNADKYTIEEYDGLEIKNLTDGKYYIYEVTAPTILATKTNGNVTKVSTDMYPLYVQDRYMVCSEDEHDEHRKDLLSENNEAYTKWAYMGWIEIGTDSSTGETTSSINSKIYERQIISVSSSNSETTARLGNYRAATINLIKKDVDENISLSDAKFVIYFEGEYLDTNDEGDRSQHISGWMKGNYNGLKTYVSGIDKATVYEIDGTKTFTYLSYGTYYIYETTAPSGDYDLKNQEGYMQTTDSSGNALPGASDLSGTSYAYCGSISVDNSDVKKNSTTATVTSKTLDNQPSGQLTLYKFDKDRQEVKLTGAMFAIYCVTTNSNVSDGWLKSSTGTSEYVEFSKKSIYSINSASTIISNLVYGEYYIYEVYAPSGYFLEYQEGYQQEVDDDNNELPGVDDLRDTSYVYCGCVHIDRHELEGEQNIYNEFFASITIVKTDSETGSAVEGIGFKIKNNTGANGTTTETWLYWSDDGEATGSDRYNTNAKIGQTTDENQASIFYTDSSGKITINHVDVGSLQVIAERSFTTSEVDSKNLYYKTDTSVTQTVAYSELSDANKANGLFEFNLVNTKPYSLKLWKYDSNYGPIGSFTTGIEALDNELKTITANVYILYYSPVDEVDSVGSNYDGTNYTELYLNSDGTYSTTPQKIEVSSDSWTVIENIRRGTYVICECDTPTGYDITQQYGYNSSTGQVDCGEVEVGDQNGGTNLDNYEDDADPDSLISSIVNNGYIAPLVWIYNHKYVSRLTGIVWKDNAIGKLEEYDSLYRAAQDTELSGIKVTLYQITSEGDVEIASTTTDSNGKYTFSKDSSVAAANIFRKVLYWDLRTFYVSFEYDNETYVVVDPFVTGSNSNEDYDAINSKAQEYLMEEDELSDNLLVAGGDNNPGKAITNKEATSLQDTGCLAKYYNESNYTIENINLGLLLKEEPSMEVYETLSYAYLTINGFTYIYYYDTPEEEVTSYANKDELPADVLKQLNSVRYESTDTVSVYSSDIASTKAETSNMSLYLVYSIYVYNPEKLEVDDVYNEQKLYLTFLTDTYDTTRLELSTDNSNEGSQYIGHDQFEMWSDTSNSGKAYYAISNSEGTGVNSKSVYKNGIGAGETKKTYIQFRVKDSALQELLTGDDSITYQATTANAIGFHEYLRTDNLWNHTESVKDHIGYAENIYKAYVDRDPEYDTTNLDGDIYYIHRSKTLRVSSGSLYVKLELYADREVSGVVYEDVAEETETTYIGNGKIDSTEVNRVEDVKVELLEVSTVSDLSELVPATLYVKDSSSSNGYKETYPAETTTNESGEYSFTGVIPGFYFIRFTYGDGSQKIGYTDSNGDFKEIDVTSVDYKSTILDTTDESYLKNAMEYSWNDYDAIEESHQGAEGALEHYYSTGTFTSNYLLEWYKYLDENTSYNTAVDNLNMKDLYNNYIYTEKGIYNSDKELIVGYHYDENNKIDYMYEVQYDNSGKSTDDTSKVIGTFNYSDDGELESIDYTGGSEVYPLTIQAYTPEFAISVENTAEKYTSGNTHVNVYNNFDFGIVTQPETDTEITKTVEVVKMTVQTGSTKVDDLTSEYVSVFDTLKQNIGIELKEKEIYGSSIEATYKIEVKNTSQFDYIEKEGTDEYGTYYKYGEITGSAKAKEITVNEVIDDIDEKYVITDLIKIGEVTQTKHTSSSSETAGTVTVTELTEDDQTLGEGSTTTTTSVKFEGWESIAKDESVSIEYSVYALLNTSDDTFFTNPARITSISLSQLTTLTSTYVWGERSKTTVSIYPATGGDQRKVYFVVGAIALLVIAGGIILLKKKILK